MSFDLGEVLRVGEEFFGFGGLRKLDAKEPAGGFGRLVEERGVLLERVVDGDDFSGNGTVDVCSGFGRFENAGFLARFEFVSDFGKFNVDDIAELFLGMVGDTDRADISLDLEPLVRFGEEHAAILFGV